MNASQQLTTELEIDKAVSTLWYYRGYIRTFLPPFATINECREFVTKNIGTGNNLQKLGANIESNLSNVGLENLGAALKR